MLIRMQLMFYRYFQYLCFIFSFHSSLYPRYLPLVLYQGCIKLPVGFTLLSHPNFGRVTVFFYPGAENSEFYDYYYTITLWFPCLDGLIQTRGNVARVKKSERNTSRRRVILCAFLNSSNIPKCLDQAIQLRKP